MAKQTSISSYLSKNFQSSFFTIFLPLFFIGSLVFIIKISALTTSIQISFIEMMQLFSYNLPSILFYTLPISFLVAIVMTLLRLSSDNELMALFALGSNAKTILYRFSFIALLFSIILLILSLALMPKTKQQFKAFKHEKTSQAQININPSKLGQKFGDLFVYVKSKENDEMRDIVIYKKDSKHANQLFIAKKANFENNNSLITLTLKEGSGYTFTEDALKKINYETMKVFQSLNSDAFTYSNIVQYWINLSLNPKKKSQIFFFIFASLIPLIGLAMVASFAVINPRYQKNYAYHVLALSSIVLYGLAIILKSKGTPLMLFTFSTLSLLIGFYLYKRLVLRFF
ncbi:MAG: Predicted permease YjgP/YjgQ family [uncultured Sulfurovum sp.]|uniref:Predicted permease YjgP/YjgQ family n=1 Tax=uncultured Sulfurovum sp. TaxID=269237 RepID=A0A6S6UD78_9BACT|nr:MAG: Predicted permease YjgP/YjgQ family [uncultured Sulfurovum sp.]